MSNGSKATIPLGQIAEIDMGTSPPGTSYNKEGIGVPLINGPTEFTDNSPVPQQWTTEPTRVCRKGDILICVRGASTGRMNTADREYCIGRGVAAIRDREDPLATPLLRYVIEHQLPSLLRFATGSTFVAVDKKAISNIPVPAFDARQRRETARLLNRSEEVELLLSRIITAKREFKRGLMQELLTGRRRFPEFEASRWEMVPLGHFFVEKDVRNTGGTIEFVYSCSKLYGVVPQNERFKNRVAARDVSHYKVVEPGNLVYDPMLLWDGSIGFVPAPRVGVVSPAYATFSFREDRGDRTFISYALKSHRAQQLYRIISQGTNVRRRKAHPADFLRIKIPVPTELEEQARIGSVIANIDRQIDLLQSLRNQIETQKRGLMQKLLTGELAVPVSSEPEPVHA